MTLSNPQAQKLWRDGAQALRSGQPTEALKAFRLILADKPGDATVWFGVALACRQAERLDYMRLALSVGRARDARNVRALMMKADHFEALGDRVASASFYRAVVRIADAAPALAADLPAEVQRAREMEAANSARFEAHLRTRLEAAGLDRREARRVRDCFKMMLGRKEMLIQRPTQYFFPELPQIEFYGREELLWFSKVEQASDAIRDELLAILRAEEEAFTPYHEPTADGPMFDRDGLVGNPSWSAFHMVKGGDVIEANASRCPRTMEALAEAPLCRIPGRTPSILFSLLRPGARIPPHHGLINTRLICHLPLIVPEGCGFRVGAETRQWVEGRGWAFDDSVEHEAWNASDRTRVILIFDVWKPELSELERDLVSVMLQASASFGSDGPSP